MPRKIPRVVRFTDPGPWTPALDGSEDRPEPRGPSAFASRREIGWTDGVIDEERSPVRYYLHARPSTLADVNLWLAAAKMPPFSGADEPPAPNATFPALFEFTGAALARISAVMGGSGPSELSEFVRAAVEREIWLADGALRAGAPGECFRVAWHRESLPQERADWPQEQISPSGTDMSATAAAAWDKNAD